MDENGARFTALVENFFHLNKALAPEEQSKELAPRDTIWALHSQSQVNNIYNRIDNNEFRFFFIFNRPFFCFHQTHPGSYLTYISYIYIYILGFIT